MNKLKNERRSVRRVGILLCMLCIALFSFGQQTAVTGVVTDQTGEPVIGATIQQKGSTMGTITDVDGKFKIMIVDISKAELVISYVGYETQTLPLKGRKTLKVVLAETFNELAEVTVVAYGVQKKETLTGAISSVKTDALLQSPNASVANSLAGKITGLSTVQTSGQPGAEDPKIYVRGVGSLTDEGATPLILVDGVERDFFQMDPNEIENVTVLKDASATAVFGVRGANGVILVTTRRGEEGKAKISVNSSVAVQVPTRVLERNNSYVYASLMNERERNDYREPIFGWNVLEHFRLGDSPIIYPDMDWFDYMTKPAALQTQHNLNVSGGTSNVRYFVSLGYMFQDGLTETFGNKETGYKYNRYNYRANLDLDITKTTTLKLSIGGVVGDQKEPATHPWKGIADAQPFASPGMVDGHIVVSGNRYRDVRITQPISDYMLRGYHRKISNTMNLDLNLTQKLDFITKGLSAEVKGAYNTDYSYTKNRHAETAGLEIYTPYYQSELDNPGMGEDDPNFNRDIVYRASGLRVKLPFGESTSRGRNWYFEASLRYNRKFGDHNISGLLLYNQHKKYYPYVSGARTNFEHIPTAYVGLVGRVTYDYKSRYMAEFNVGYNGSENFVPDKRFGTFPALSLGYILSEEDFMKNQKVFSFLKFRASVGLVGNDNMNSNRFLYLPDSYNVNKEYAESGGDKWTNNWYGYNFGLNNSTLIKGAVEQLIGNPDVTWETALKQNYGVDMHFLDNRLKVNLNFFMEDRKDILVKRQTISSLAGLSKDLLPVVNMGKVKNKGYEVEVNWNDKVGKNFDYYVNANVSYSKNKIIFQDEVEPLDPYSWRTGRQVGAVFGYVAERLYNKDDFADANKGILKEGYAKPTQPVYPGDVKYMDLNGDDIINVRDQQEIGFPERPNYVFGLNLGANYKGFFFSMNWTGTAERSVIMEGNFTNPILVKEFVDKRWTEATAATASHPRLSLNSDEYNKWESTMWVKDGSYLKLKNLTFGYNFTGYPALKKIGIQQLGLKFTAYNLLMFDHLGIVDPESKPNLGTTYPITKMYNFGLNLTF